MALEQLPEETITGLLDHLNIGSLLALQSTNNYFYLLVGQYLANNEVRNRIGNGLRPVLQQMQRRGLFYCWMDITGNWMEFEEETLRLDIPGPYTRIESALRLMFPLVANGALVQPDELGRIYVGIRVYERHNEVLTRFWTPSYWVPCNSDPRIRYLNELLHDVLRNVGGGGMIQDVFQTSRATAWLPAVGGDVLMDLLFGLRAELSYDSGPAVFNAALHACERIILSV